MRYFVTLPSEEEMAIDIIHHPTGATEIMVDGSPVAVDAEETDGAWSVRVGNRVVELWLDGQPPELRLVAGGSRSRARVESERSRLGAVEAGGSTGGGSITAPMPGRVVKVLVAMGDEVEAGAPVIVVEAMKMENELSTDVAGTVAEICVEPGQNVEGGMALVRLE